MSVFVEAIVLPTLINASDKAQESIYQNSSLSIPDSIKKPSSSSTSLPPSSITLTNWSAAIPYADSLFSQAIALQRRCFAATRDDLPEAFVKQVVADNIATFVLATVPSSLLASVNPEVVVPTIGDANAPIVVGACLTLHLVSWSKTKGREGDIVRMGNVYFLYVDGSTRGTGLGTTLLDNAADLSRQRGATELFLDVREGNPARKLYERKGFTTQSVIPEYYDFGATAEERTGREMTVPIDKYNWGSDASIKPQSAPAAAPVESAVVSLSLPVPAALAPEAANAAQAPAAPLAPLALVVPAASAADALAGPAATPFLTPLSLSRGPSRHAAAATPMPFLQPPALTSNRSASTAAALRATAAATAAAARLGGAFGAVSVVSPVELPQRMPCYGAAACDMGSPQALERADTEPEGYAASKRQRRGAAETAGRAARGDGLASTEAAAGALSPVLAGLGAAASSAAALGLRPGDIPGDIPGDVPGDAPRRVQLAGAAWARASA